MPAKSRAQQFAALAQHASIALAQLLEQVRRPLDVSEKQRDGPRGQVTHSGSPLPRFAGRRERRDLSHRMILDEVAHNTQGFTYSLECTMPSDILSMLTLNINSQALCLLFYRTFIHQMRISPISLTLSA
jgi:hypothetical protein